MVCFASESIEPVEKRFKAAVSKKAWGGLFKKRGFEAWAIDKSR
jgi:hypothetical protein